MRRVSRNRALVVGLIAGLLSGCSPEPKPETLVKTNPYMTTDDRTIMLEGDMIRYRVEGPNDAPTLILLHGFTDSLNGWDRLAAELDDEFRLIRPDFPGHGMSGPNRDGDYSNEALVQFVSAFIDATTDTPPILVGNSLGGLAAWRVAAAHPETVAGLVLIAPGGVPHNGVTETPAKVPTMLQFYLKKAPDAGVRAAMKAMYGDPTRLVDAEIERFGDLMRQPGNGEAFVARAAQFTAPDPTDDLTLITAPTLILWGEADTVLPQSHANVFKAAIPNSQFVSFAGVGHLPQAEVPANVAQAVRNFASATVVKEAP